MREKFAFLKERAEQFFQDAEYNYQCKNLELCAFHLEQSCQLYLKYTLGVKLGDFPHVHNLFQLLKSVYKVSGNRDFSEFLEKNKNTVEAMEQAYFDARYYDTQFEISQVENMMKFSKELQKILRAIWS